MRAWLAIVGTLAVLALLGAAPAWAATPWPPAKGSGQLYVHYGEEHWNDADGLTLLPKVVADTIRYRPELVRLSFFWDGRLRQRGKLRRVRGGFRIDVTVRSDRRTLRRSRRVLVRRAG